MSWDVYMHMLSLREGGYFNKILIKLGIKENTQEVNWAVESCRIV